MTRQDRKPRLDKTKHHYYNKNADSHKWILVNGFGCIRVQLSVFIRVNSKNELTSGNLANVTWLLHVTGDDWSWRWTRCSMCSISSLLVAYESNVFLVLFADTQDECRCQCMCQNFLMSSSRTLVSRVCSNAPSSWLLECCKKASCRHYKYVHYRKKN